MQKLTLLLLIILLSQNCRRNDPFWSGYLSPEVVAEKVTNELLSRDEYMMYRTDDVRAVHYAEVCAAFGAVRIAGQKGDTAMLRRLEARYRKVITDRIENTANHVDANVYGILPLELHLQRGDEAFLKQGMELVDGQWTDTLPDGLTSQVRYWIDDVWMIGSLQVQAYRVTGRKVYLDRAARVTAAYLEKLQQPNGLFYHGENAPFHWGRGNGWMAGGMAVVLSELPAEHPLHDRIVTGYRQMMKALLRYQAEDGMWRQLVDYPDAWKETSCTAMFGYALSVGVERGILAEPEYTEAYQKAWNALTGYLDELGRLTDVCVGTGQSTEASYYLERPVVTGDFHGQAPLLWFAFTLLDQ